ncbi:hypothetical protein RND71_018548 [Anisodus tanguticus]|uniref:Uncharacterized protein n=1 Tax=Anisodus tanguticus TaxID=243964 RepID=A0AAE1VC66_9SOLA|nr:hypothetical protein RND71_018548 [Anisodus tanguticus]
MKKKEKVLTVMSNLELLGDAEDIFVETLKFFKRKDSTKFEFASRSLILRVNRSLINQGVKSVNFAKPGLGYIWVGSELMDQNEIPKGHLAVYVSEKKDDACRVLVPVIYFNHPLFVDLLSEAEMVYGFNHSGGIQIPCGISEFEHNSTIMKKVMTRIAAATGGGGSCRGRRRWSH